MKPTAHNSDHAQAGAADQRRPVEEFPHVVDRKEQFQRERELTAIALAARARRPGASGEEPIEPASPSAETPGQRVFLRIAGNSWEEARLLASREATVVEDQDNTLARLLAEGTQ